MQGILIVVGLGLLTYLLVKSIPRQRCPNPKCGGTNILCLEPEESDLGSFSHVGCPACGMVYAKGPEKGAQYVPSGEFTYQELEDRVQKLQGLKK